MNVTVVRAANVLNICERRLFEFAHQYWYTREAESTFISAVLHEYLINHITPPWVMHFARAVMRAYEEGNLNPLLFGVSPGFEQLPLLWSLVLRAPRVHRYDDSDNYLVA